MSRRTRVSGQNYTRFTIYYFILVPPKLCRLRFRLPDERITCKAIDIPTKAIRRQRKQSYDTLSGSEANEI